MASLARLQLHSPAIAPIVAGVTPLIGMAERVRWARVLAVGGLASALVLVLVVAAGAAGSSRAPAYCTIPTVGNPPWGFHVGEQITGATGTYAHGHGNINLATRAVTGIICQVDRVRNAPDRQIILSVDPKLVYSSHTAVILGVPGNVMKIDVKVKSSTDPECKVGTSGQVVVFASYNGVHRDLVQFTFPAACRRHDHRYTGLDVVTNVPPE
jgi:hypothetical protein